jgi:putative membrane protein
VSDATAGPARRLHPGTVGLRVLRQLPSTLLGLPAFFAVAGGKSLGFVLLAAAGLAVVAAVATWLDWRAFTYRIDAQELTIAAGVLAKSRRSIPLSRIQDVSIEQRTLQRLFGLASVKLETGGGDKDEGALDSVSLGEAQRLRDLLRRAAAPAAADPAGAPVAAEGERVLAIMPLRRVLLMGLFRFSLVWLAGIYAVLQSVGGYLDLDWDRLRDWAGEARSRVGGRERALLLILTLAPVALALGVAAGVVRTLLTEYGFRLRFAAGRFRRTRGLLTRSEVVVAARRVQLALVERGLVSGRLGWAGLVFQTLGGSDDAGGRQTMLPFGRREEIDGIMAAADLPSAEGVVLTPVVRGHVARMLVRYVAVPTAVVLAASPFRAEVLFLLLALPLPIAAALLARSRHRYALGERALHLARGVLTQRAWTVPLENVQAVSVSRSWLQRRLGTATVHVGTASAPGGAAPDIVDAGCADASALAARLLRAGSEEEGWRTRQDSNL